MVRIIHRKPEPLCPECNTPMVLREPKDKTQRWEPFWGCAKFPECKGLWNINFTTGKIMEDEGWWMDADHPGDEDW